MWYGKICTPRAASSHLWMDAHTSDNTPTYTATALSINNNIIPLTTKLQKTQLIIHVQCVTHVYIIYSISI